MIISQNELRKQTVELLRQVDAQIKTVEATAHRHGIDPKELRDDHGNWVMVPLLVARVQVISTLVQINQPRSP